MLQCDLSTTRRPNCNCVTDSQFALGSARPRSSALHKDLRAMAGIQIAVTELHKFNGVPMPAQDLSRMCCCSCLGYSGSCITSHEIQLLKWIRLPTSAFQAQLRLKSRLAGKLFTPGRVAHGAPKLELCKVEAHIRIDLQAQLFLKGFFASSFSAEVVGRIGCHSVLICLRIPFLQVNAICDAVQDVLP